MTDLHARLNAECAALSAFVELLQTEQQQLVAEDVGQLQALAAEKSRTASQLALMIQDRREAMQVAGISDLSVWLGTHDAASFSVWQNILHLAGQAQTLNQTNGELIRVRLRHNQQALSVLHAAATGSAGLYGRDGQPDLQNTSKRILGSV